MTKNKQKPEIKKELSRMLIAAKEAERVTSQWSSSFKKKLLLHISKELVKNTKKIILENKKDLVQAKKDGLSSAMIDRLTLTSARIAEMGKGVAAVADLPDPIGKLQAEWKRPNGLRISKVTVPIGVIFIIYESRPNVTVECASLCLKSGNVVILRGGREAFHSNQVLTSIFEKVLKRENLPTAAVNLVQTTDRSAVDFLLKQEAHIQLVIPRGGESLIRKVARMSRIPVVKHYQGICHIYVDAKADLTKAATIAYNAKMQRPGVCNAMETLLIHEKVADPFLSLLGPKLKAGGCEVRGDLATCRYLPWAKQAKPHDYGHEYLEKILAVKIVSDLKEAMEHIQKFSSSHTEAIVTEDQKAAQVFVDQIDSSSVMVNASTRFADGFQYGFGAEIGISTDKIHARGPMGLEGLTSYKYIVRGNGQIRS